MKILFFIILSCQILNVYSADITIGKILYTKGTVYIDKIKAKKGDKFTNLQIIKTSKNSLAILALTNGSKLKINALSSLKVKIRKSKTKEKTLISLLKGSLFTKFNGGKNKNKKLILKTPTASLGVRGTEFFTSFGKENSSDVWMCVNKGQVAVKGLGEKKVTLVNAGEGVVIKKFKKRSKTSNPKALPWTKKLNWELNPKKGNLVNKISIEEAYSNPLDQDYD